MYARCIYARNVLAANPDSAHPTRAAAALRLVQPGGVKKAGLVDALSGTIKLTVFAPTNAAFARVPKATLTKLATHKSLLVKVLEYHVLPGVVPASKVIKLRSAKTVEGARVHFSVLGGHAYVNRAQIIKTNTHASNGLIHVINAVLIPPS
jgi:uncharacterized surface protein with fasciclin (FAS1) repeats